MNRLPSLPGRYLLACLALVHLYRFVRGLEIVVNGNAKDPRADEIPGDVMANGEPNPSWGLHLIDVHVAIGNLVDIVGRQAATYQRSRSSQF